MAATEQTFVDNWGGLAEAFGMPRDLGRTHALIFIAAETLDHVAIAERLQIAPSKAKEHVAELVDWGVVHEETTAGSSYYATNHDPWVWFLKILGERHRREFIPVLRAMRQTLASAQMLDSSHPQARALQHRADRFTRFVEDLSSLIELFLRLGAKPMSAVLRTLAKIAPRS